MTREEWAGAVSRYERSGLTAKAFAAREGLSARSLSWWKWKLGSEARGETEALSASTSTSTTAMSFVELRTSAPVTSSPPFELVLAESGHILRVPADADLESMCGIVDALEGALR